MTTESKTDDTMMYLQEWASRAMEQVFDHAVLKHHAIPEDLRDMLLTIGNILRGIHNHKDYAGFAVEQAPPIIFMDSAPWWEVFKDFADRNNLGSFESGPARTFVDLIRAVAALTDSHQNVLSEWFTS